MRVLVTGATGFIGSHIVEKLLLEGYEVLAAGGSRLPSIQDRPGLIPQSVDISNRPDVRKLEQFGDFDAVVHCAGIAHRYGVATPDEYFAVNVDGTRHIAELAARVKAKHLILISSVLVYGNLASSISKVITENDICSPEEPYSQSKLFAEHAARTVCGENNLNLTVLRAAPVIGEGGKGNIARLIEFIYRGRFLWVGSGANVKSFVYVRDLADVVALAIKKGGDMCGIYNVVGGNITMNRLVVTISETLGKSVPWPRISVKMVRQLVSGLNRIGRFTRGEKMSRTLEMWLSSNVYASEKLNSTYNYQPQVEIAEGIRRQVINFLSSK